MAIATTTAPDLYLFGRVMLAKVCDANVTLWSMTVIRCQLVGANGVPPITALVTSRRTPHFKPIDAFDVFGGNQFMVQGYLFAG